MSGHGNAHTGTSESFHPGTFPAHHKPALHLPGAPTLKGEPKAWKVRGSIPQPCCPEKGQAWDHGGGLGPPHAGSSGRPGFSRRVWRSLQPPWTLPQDLEKSRQLGREGKGGRAWGSPKGSDYSPKGKRLGGRIPFPLHQGCPAWPQSETHPHRAHPQGHPALAGTRLTTSPSSVTSPSVHTFTDINSQILGTHFMPVWGRDRVLMMRTRSPSSKGQKANKKIL